MVISFASQKGGVGKTTLLLSIATALHYKFDKSVRVLDTDLPQCSISKLRKLEESFIKKAITAYKDNGQILYYFRKVIENRRKVYPIQEIDLLDINDQGKFKEDIILVDSVGTVNTKGYDELLNVSDYIIVPTSVDYLEFEATKRYMEEILKEAKEQGIIKGYYALLNKVNPRTTGDTDTMFELFEKFNIPYFEQYIPLGEAYKREPMTNEKYFKTGIRSTVIPTSNIYINRVTEELLNKIK